MATNIGIDFVMFNNRLRGSLDLFQRRQTLLPSADSTAAPAAPSLKISIKIKIPSSTRGDFSVRS